MALNTADYKVVHNVSPGVDLADLLENQVADHHAVVFAPGTYTFTSRFINYPWRNTHLFADDTSYMDGPLQPKPGGSLVKIRAGLQLLGAQLLRITGVDFLTAPSMANLYGFGSSVFMTDTCFVHQSGDASPWGAGAALSGYSTQYSFECLLRHSVIDHSLETAVGTPVLLKDGCYLRMTASSNGWRPKVLFGKRFGLQLAGTGGYLHDLDIDGPGKTVDSTTGIEVARGGGHVYFLKTLNSTAVRDCEIGILAESGGLVTMYNNKGTPFPIVNCKWGVIRVQGGSIRMKERASVTFSNVDIPFYPSQDGMFFG